MTKFILVAVGVIIGVAAVLVIGATVAAGAQEDQWRFQG